MDSPQDFKLLVEAVPTSPRVTVVVPSCLKPGREAYVEAALASIVAQTFQGFELILVDDGSMVPLTSLALPVDSRIRTVRHPHNLGLSSARNTGIRQARGELIAFLDDDDVWLPGYLEHMVDIFDRAPGVGMVLSQVAFLYVETGLLVPKQRQGPEGPNTLKDLVRYGNASPSTTMFRRTSLEELEGFDAELRSCGDLDLILRAAERLSVHVSHAVLCHYRVHADNMSRSDLALGLDVIEVWEKFLRRHRGQRKPGGLSRQWIRHTIARQHHRVARAYAADGNIDEAFGHLQQALGLWPTIGRSFSPLPKTPIHRALNLVKPYAALATLGLAMTPLGAPLRPHLKPR